MKSLRHQSYKGITYMKGREVMTIVGNDTRTEQHDPELTTDIPAHGTGNMTAAEVTAIDQDGWTPVKQPHTVVMKTPAMVIGQVDARPSLGSIGRVRLGRGVFDLYVPMQSNRLLLWQEESVTPLSTVETQDNQLPDIPRVTTEEVHTTFDASLSRRGLATERSLHHRGRPIRDAYMFVKAKGADLTHRSPKPVRGEQNPALASEQPTLADPARLISSDNVPW